MLVILLDFFVTESSLYEKKPASKRRASLRGRGEARHDFRKQSSKCGRGMQCGCDFISIQWKTSLEHNSNSQILSNSYVAFDLKKNVPYILQFYNGTHATKRTKKNHKQNTPTKHVGQKNIKAARRRWMISMSIWNSSTVRPHQSVGELTMYLVLKFNFEEMVRYGKNSIWDITGAVLIK